MASLEELLAEEGFKKGKLKPRPPRASAATRAVSMPLYPNREQNALFRTSDSIARRGRTRADAFSRRSQSVLSENGVGGGRLRDSLPRRKISVDWYNEDPQEIEEEDEGFNGRIQVPRTYSVEEFSNESQESEESRDRFSDYFQENKRFKERYRMDLREDERFKSRNIKNSQVKPSFNGDLRSRRPDDLGISGSEPALDEAAIQAVVSILTGYIRRFLKDENFRTSIRNSCASFLDFGGAKVSHHKDSGVVANLKEAIGTIERAVKGAPDSKELRKASLKLSVITGLNIKELKDGYTSGIPNLHLAACAHVYLSVIYKLQKKDRVSAKHLLQVFCDSPNQARTSLLPGLWDHLFFPHLSHLRAWYDKEAESMPRSTSRLKKMKLLDKAYNDLLDIGTYKFAVYYKEWLMEGTEAPALPSVDVPSAYLYGIAQEEGSHVSCSDGFSSMGSPVSSQPMVSKRLYESVFGQSKKLEAADELKGSEEDEEEEVEEEQLNVYVRSSEGFIEEDEETGIYSPKPGVYTEEHIQEYRGTIYPELDASSHTLQADEWTDQESCGLSTLNVPDLRRLNVECESILSLFAISGCTPVPQAKENQLALKELAQAVFQPQEANYSNDFDDVTLKHSGHLPAHDLYQNKVQLSNIRSTDPKLKKTGMVSTTSKMDSFVTSCSTEPFGKYEDFDQGSFFSSIPKDFMCPLTGQLFKDPVTLETGQTFERVAIKEWFDEGNRTCPVTGKALECVALPVTNFVLKRVIDGWKSEHCRNLLVFATQIAGKVIKQDYRSKDESALFIIEQLLTGFSTEERMENAKHLISLGGLHFLLRRFEVGGLEEKTRVLSLLLCCIKADGCCRSCLAANIKRPCILELLHSKQVGARTNAVLLLIELICLNRRMAITSFLSGLQTEAIVNTMHVLLVYLQSSPPEEKVLVAVVLLHFDLMVEPRRYSIYREEAVDAITVSLECSLSDEKLVPYARRALLMLGGHFSLSGEELMESWLLKQAGFYGDPGIVSIDFDDEDDESVSGEEAKEREDWSKNVATVLLGNGKKSFLETISRCLGSGNIYLVRTCLATVAWLSHALASLSFAEFQLSAFSTLIPRLKESLENIEQVDHRVLASISLLNFSKISECRVLLMTLKEELCDPISSLVEVTWTAKELYAVIFREHEHSTGEKVNLFPFS